MMLEFNKWFIFNWHKVCLHCFLQQREFSFELFEDLFSNEAMNKIH